MKEKKLRPIYIKWLDHYAHNEGWSKADYSKSPDGLICETVGFLMHETAKSFHVAMNYSFKEDGMSDASNSMTIIKSCIIKKRFLK